jgi:hypothetical protein
LDEKDINLIIIMNHKLRYKERMSHRQLIFNKSKKSPMKNQKNIIKYYYEII